MSKIALTPNASGSGTITITAPNTNTNRTIALPDVAGNVVTTGDTGTVTSTMTNSTVATYAAATNTFTNNVDAPAFTGTSNVAYNALASNSIGDSNVPYNSWGTPNSTYYRWVLPKAGTYRIEASMRIRLWGVHGMLLSRIYNNTTSSVMTDAYNYPTTRMNLENRGGGTAETLNIQIQQNWIITTSADNQDIHHQLFTDNNSTNSSVQSDSNGYNYHAWYRIG